MKVVSGSDQVHGGVLRVARSAATAAALQATVGVPVLAKTRVLEGAAAFGIIMSAFGGGALLGIILSKPLPTSGAISFRTWKDSGAVLPLISLAWVILPSCPTAAPPPTPSSSIAAFWMPCLTCSKSASASHLSCMIGDRPWPSTGHIIIRMQ